MYKAFGETASSVLSFLRTIITVNDEYYVIMDTNYLRSELHNMDTNNTIGHTTYAIFSILHIRFESIVILSGRDVKSSLRSSELTTVGYFLRGFLKTQMFAASQSSCNTQSLDLTQFH